MEEASQYPDSAVAESILRELLQQPLLLQELKNEVISPNVARLLYLAHKNLGSILRAQKRVREAVQEMLEATKLDKSDHMMWYSMGILGVELQDYLFARKALET